MKRNSKTTRASTAHTVNSQQLAIADHGIIGDLATVALVGINGTIDFMCLPRFDSPTIFASLLDTEKGGYFALAPDSDDVRVKQIYLPDTNILLTRFLSPEGVAELIDFMPISDGRSPTRLIRRLKVVSGKLSFNLAVNVQLDYARHSTHAKNSGDVTTFTSRSKKQRVRLICPLPIEVEDSHALSEFTLRKDDSVDFILEQVDDDREEDIDVDALFDETATFWRLWSAKSQYQGRWRETVNRSALVLKLLTSKEYGSMVAAPTFGLPETIGGERNWDYRYTWIRDASFSIFALMRLGFVDEAGEFMTWIGERTKSCKFDGSLKTMYRIDGDEDLEETELEHLDGFENSAPVRIGNGASDQLQLDIYGELMDAVYLANKYGKPSSHDGWAEVTRIIEFVEKNWKRKDHGIWEMRAKPREFLHSRMMCWVAVDRAVRLAVKRSLPAPFAEWSKLRNDIYYSVYEDFWNEKDGHFVQAKGNDELDASMLLMPLMKFISPTDPRWLSTLKKIEEVLVDDTMVHRYRDGTDNLRGREHSFTTCCFWYIECLAKSGRTAEARLLFDKMLSYANHLGLYSEELGPSGEHLGNFPQALTHLALISAAFTIDRALAGTAPGAWQT